MEKGKLHKTLTSLLWYRHFQNEWHLAEEQNNHPGHLKKETTFEFFY
jgi:hypothetical protein